MGHNCLATAPIDASSNDDFASCNADAAASTFPGATWIRELVSQYWRASELAWHKSSSVRAFMQHRHVASDEQWGSRGNTTTCRKAETGTDERRRNAPFLDALPHGLVESLILPLLDARARASLKASCKAGGSLVDSTINAVRLSAGPHLQPRHQRHVANFLRRLPCLRALALPLHAVGQPLSILLAAGAGAAPPTAPCCRPLASVCSLHVELPLGAKEWGAACLEPLLAYLPSLTHVTLEGHALPTQLGPSLAAHCPQLRALTLVLGRESTASSSVKAAADAALVKALDSLATLPLMESLTVRQVDTGALPAATAQRMLAAVATALPTLQRLSWDAPWSWAGLVPLAGMVSLASLELVCAPMYDAAHDGLLPSPDVLQGSLGSLPSLEELAMPSIELTWGVWHRVLAALPRLRHASFRRCRLVGEPQPLEHLRGLSLAWESSLGALLLALGGLPNARAVRAQASIHLQPGSLAAARAQVAELDWRLRQCAAGGAEVVLAVSGDPQLLQGGATEGGANGAAAPGNGAGCGAGVLAQGLRVAPCCRGVRG